MVTRAMLDCDGVISDFVAAMTTLAFQEGLTDSLPYSTPQQEKWDFSFNTSKCWDILKSRHNFWMTLQPLVTEEEITAINEAIAKHDIYFVTTRPSTKGFSAETQTRLWLESIGVNIPRKSHVIATRSGSKGKVCNALDLTVALDDYISNLADLQANGVTAYALYQKYNAGWTPSVPTVADFLALL